MKKIKYSLENILKIRHNYEDKKLNEMSMLLNQYSENMNIEKRMVVNIDKTIFKMNNEDTLNIKNQKFYYVYLVKLRLELKQQKIIVEKTKREYENKKNEYINAQMDRKVIEKHKERFVETITLKTKKAEEQTFNELAIISFNRKKIQ